MSLVSTDRFKIRRRLGQGGMGVVYEAFDEERRTRVALKTLQHFDAASITGFKREFRALQGLAHRNLVALDELFCEGGTWFFTMELLDGEDFLSWVRGVAVSSPFQSTVHESVGMIGARVRLSEEPQALRSYDEKKLRTGLRQLFEGLSALHSADRVHRDVKPSNVFVTREGRVVLLDFGLVTEVGVDDEAVSCVVGTPEYMSPEQAATREVGPPADLYAVGVMLYEILTGERPFVGAPLAVMMEKQGREPRPVEALAPDAPNDLAELCSGLLRFDPERRPTCTEALRTIAASAPEPPAPAPTSSSGGPTFVGRKEELQALREAFDESVRGEFGSVLVCGESGIGKSALVRHFASELSLVRRGLVVLEGRCYEREAVPYKALDGIVDVLARRLSRMAAAEVAPLLPTRSAFLARMFPVMLHVPLVAKAHAAMDLDVEPHDLRRRALSALRELLTRVASAAPTIVIIDDLQWADNEGLRALGEILQPPDPPPFLLIGTVRSRPGRKGAESDGFERVRAALPQETRVIEVTNLGTEEARELAKAMLGRVQGSGVDPGLVAGEARGHPLFVEELARHVALGGSAGSDVKLDDAIYSRVAHLEPATREMAELVAVAGKPIPQEVIASAARMEPAEFNRRAAMLRAANLVRTRGTRWADAIEPYHDRVRESVLAQLEPARRRALHEALALALEAPISSSSGRGAGGRAEDAWASSHRDPENLAVHWREAGHRERAGQYAQSAGDQALRALAFDRAAEWYEQALELDPREPALEVGLRSKLGDALANAGRGAQAAAELELAAVSSPPAEALELRRRAADQLLRSGHFDRGMEASRAVLAAIGMRLPSTWLGTVVMLLYYRLRLFVRGYRFTERDKAHIPPAELTRIDTCWSVGMALLFVDPGLGFVFLTRALLLALRAGELERIARCVGMETGVLGASGSRAWKRTQRLIDLARELADRSGSAHCRFFALGPAGGALFCAGRFEEGAERIQRSLDVLEDRSLGLIHERVTMRIFLIDAFRYTGGYRELRRLQREGLEDARARGDLYAEVELTVGNANFAWLADDRPDLADDSARKVMSQWSTSAFHLEHMHDMEGRVHTRLYTGDAEDAHSLARELHERTRRTLLWRIQVARISLLYLRGGAALLMLERGLGDRSELLREALAAARALDREGAEWSAPLARVVRAGVSLHSGSREEALSGLDRAAEELSARGMGAYALAVRDRAARLRGPPGAPELARVTEAWHAEEVVSPERMSRMLAPGLLV